MQTFMVRGRLVQISDEDFAWASQWRWQWVGSARRDHVGRAVWRAGRMSTLYMHQAIWARMGRTVPAGYQIDHKDRDRANNQRGNLRVLTPSANMANREGVKGYSWSKRANKWWARIKKDRVLYGLGCFKTEEEAAAAFETARRRLYPELYE